MKKVTGKDFVSALKGGIPISSRDLEILGDMEIEGQSEQEKITVSGLDLEGVDISGSVIIRNAIFNRDLNLSHARLAGQSLIIENVIVNGGFFLPSNLQEMVEDTNRVVRILNIKVAEDVRFSEG